MKIFYLLTVQFCIATVLYAQTDSSKVDPLKDSLRSANYTEASFHGGDKAWMMYLFRNLVYPREAQAQHITGKVMVRFLVDEKGRCKEITAVSGSELLQNEAIRLIRESPRWVPATVDGHATRSYKEQGISFMLE